MEIERERMNVEAWLIGAYVQHAIGACLSKGHKYPKKPIPVSEEQPEQERQQAIRAKFEAFAIKFNKQFYEKEEVKTNGCND